MAAALVILSASSVLAKGVDYEAAREDQWVYRQQTGDGSNAPIAIFLSGDYSLVLFRATCDPVRKELILEYFGDQEVRPKKGDVLSLGGEGDGWVKFATRLIDGRLEGRVEITPKLVRLLLSPRGLDIDAPNAMDEVWHTGRAKALSRLVSGCR